jgi:hypothetical protein
MLAWLKARPLVLCSHSWKMLVRQAMSNAAELQKTGRQALWVRWLRRAGPSWSRLTAAPSGSLLHTACASSRQHMLQCMHAVSAPVNLPRARQLWTAQPAAALAGIGMPVDLELPCPLCLEQLRLSALGRHLHEFHATGGRPGASKLAHNPQTGWGGGSCDRRGSMRPC